MHKTHPGIIQRLRRAEGHLRKIVSMIEENRPCLDIAQQMQAVENAVQAAKKTLIHDHLDHCLESATGDGAQDAKATIAAFKDIAKYL